MQDLINVSMLVCAIAASLAFGVLAAHAICRGAFLFLRLHAGSIAGSKLQKAALTS